MPWWIRALVINSVEGKDQYLRLPFDLHMYTMTCTYPPYMNTHTSSSGTQACGCTHIQTHTHTHKDEIVWSWVSWEEMAGRSSVPLMSEELWVLFRLPLAVLITTSPSLQEDWPRSKAQSCTPNPWAIVYLVFSRKWAHSVSIIVGGCREEVRWWKLDLSLYTS